MTWYNDPSYMGDYAFVLNSGGQPVWKASVKGRDLPAEFNSRGAAIAAISVERRRMEKVK